MDTGTVWRMTGVENGEKTVAESERALLERQSGGRSLWYIRVDISGEGAEKNLELEYETWINEDNEVIEYAYRDPETDEVVHKELPEGRKVDKTESPAGRDKALDSWEEDWEEWRQEVNVSSESFTVGAGTFETDRMSHEEHDEETGDRLRRVLWRTKEVPDHSVKFLYENIDEELRIEGELLSVKHDYRAKFY